MRVNAFEMGARLHTRPGGDRDSRLELVTSRTSGPMV